MGTPLGTPMGTPRQEKEGKEEGRPIAALCASSRPRGDEAVEGIERLRTTNGDARRRRKGRGSFLGANRELERSAVLDETVRRGEAGGGSARVDA